MSTEDCNQSLSIECKKQMLSTEDIKQKLSTEDEKKNKIANECYLLKITVKRPPD